MRRKRQGCTMPLLEPIRPAVWGSGLRTTEAKWLSDLAEKGLVLRRTVLRAAGTRGALAVEYDAAWMHPSQAREAPRARGAAAAPAAPAPSAASDMVDVLAPPAERPPAPPYARTWRDLCDPELDRRHRAVAWQILHGTLSVGVFAAYIGRHASVEQCQCPFFFFFLRGTKWLHCLQVTHDKPLGGAPFSRHARWAFRRKGRQASKHVSQTRKQGKHASG